jgi:hypothetical protein
MGISADVFHRFILASFLSTGRGPLLTCLDFELLLRTMMRDQRKKEKGILCLVTLSPERDNTQKKYLQQFDINLHKQIPFYR